MTFFGFRPVDFNERYVMVSIGFETITMIGSLLYLRILEETSLTIFALIPISSSRVIPGFRGIPDVITTTSLSLVRE